MFRRGKTILSESASKLLSALLTAQNTIAAAPIHASAPLQSASTTADDSDETKRVKLTRSADEDEDEDGARTTG